MRPGIPFILIGPSGSGKTTLANMLLESDRSLEMSVSFTTRSPRRGEEEGNEYTFVSKQKFESLIQDGDLIEFAEVYGDYYGTSKGWVKENLDLGKDLLFILDTDGGFQMKQQFTNACVVLIVPPKIASLADRLQRRGTETEESIRKRLGNAPKEIKDGLEFCDYIVVNDKLHSTVFDLVSILRAKRLAFMDKQALLSTIT